MATVMKMDIPHFEDALFLCGDSMILPQRADPGQTFKTLVFDESSVLSLRKESRSLDPPSERDPKGGKVPKRTFCETATRRPGGSRQWGTRENFGHHRGDRCRTPKF